MIELGIVFKNKHSLRIETALSEQQFWGNYSTALSGDRKVVIPAKDGVQFLINPQEIVCLSVNDMEKPLSIIDDSYSQESEFC